ncbi:hypothetical protein BGX38DRAFT_477464 [Terfezia claveryi]|nr:hypothetical protein BGX38DRAFT_477464 [Terfezia claveryi]
MSRTISLVDHRRGDMGDTWHDWNMGLRKITGAYYRSSHTNLRWMSNIELIESKFLGFGATWATRAIAQHSRSNPTSCQLLPSLPHLLCIQPHHDGAGPTQPWRNLQIHDNLHNLQTDMGSRERKSGQPSWIICWMRVGDYAYRWYRTRRVYCLSHPFTLLPH